VPRKARKKKKSGIITVYIPVRLIDKVKNVVYWTPGLTIASFAGEAIKKTVDAMEEEREGVFPKR